MVDSIGGIAQPIMAPVPTLPASPAPVASASAQPDTAQLVNTANVAQPQASYNAQAAEQTRYQANQQMAQHVQIANPYVVGDQEFSLFKDATGQYITRYVNLKSGKVTYIPEPTLFKMHSDSGGQSQPLLNIQA
jgi:hypothetical protein